MHDLMGIFFKNKKHTYVTELFIMFEKKEIPAFFIEIKKGSR